MHVWKLKLVAFMLCLFEVNVRGQDFRYAVGICIVSVT